MITFPRSAIVVGSCALALGAAASPASAAWTSPQALPGSAGRYPLLAAYGPGGTTNVAMYGPLAFLPGTPQAPVAMSTTPPGQPFAAPTGLPDGLASPVAVSPNGTMLAVGGPRSPLDYFSLEGQRSRLRVAIGEIGATPRRIPTHQIVATRTLASAVDDNGDAAVVFSRCVGKSCATRSILATFRRHGRGFTTPIVLAKRTGYPVASVALNAHGDAIVAWIQHRTQGSGNDVRARTRLADGRLTKTHIAGPTEPVPTIAVTLTGGRHGTVSWYSEGVSEGSGGGPLTVSAADMDSRGTLSSRYVLDSGTPSGHGDADAVKGARLRAFVGADGVTTLAWTGFANGHYVVRAARVDRRVARDEALSPPTIDAQLMDLSTDAAGDAIAVWATVSAPTTTPAVAAVIRNAGSTTFGAPQLVLTGTDASGTAAGAIAPGGRVIVAGGPVSQINNHNPPPVLVTQLLG
jgi:hypothetical protein